MHRIWTNTMQRLSADEGRLAFRVVAIGYAVIALLPWLLGWVRGRYDLDYTIFNHCFWHAWEQMPLYELYPADGNLYLYGPLFAVLIAPLAVLPFQLGRLLWMLLITFVPYWAIRRLALTWREQLFLLLFISGEVYLCTFDSETNSLILACIMFTFLLVERGDDRWAALLIALGTLTKLYGIVGLAFWPFSRHKGQLLVWTAVWMVVLACVLMAVFGFDYVIGQYQEWYNVLVYKNGLNQFALGQNISLLGIVRKLSGCAAYSDLLLIVPGLLLFALPYLRFRQYGHRSFRLSIMGSALMFMVLFSTSSESYGYVIALTGVGLWYVASPNPRSRWDLALLIFAFFMASVAPSDLFYKPLYCEIIKPYALKALPASIIWFQLAWELLTKDYKPHGIAKF